MKKSFCIFFAGLLAFSLMSCEALFGSFVRPDEIDKSSVQTESFMDGVLFTWPAAKNAKYYSVRYKGKTINVDTPSFWAAYDPNSTSYPYYSQTFYIEVTAVNDAGESSSVSLYGDTLGVAPMSGEESPFSYEIIDFTSTTATVKFSGVKVRDNTSYVYEIYEYSSSSRAICTGEMNSDTVTISNLDPANEYEYAFKCKITVDVDGYKRSFKQDYGEKFKFNTKLFQAPTNVKVDSIGRTKAVISYSPLTAEQLDGVDASKVIYTVYYSTKDGRSNKISSDKGKSDPIEVTNLKPETEYSFVVRANYGSSNEENAASEAVTATTLKGLVVPANLVLTEADGSNSYSSVINIKYDRAAEDDSVLYYAEYKVLKSSYFSGSKNKAVAYDADGINIDVNKGNRYIVRVAAYDPEESSTILYSEEQTIQLTKMNTTLTGEPIFEGLYDLTTGELASASIVSLNALDTTYVFDMLPGANFTYEKNGGTISYDITAALNSDTRLDLFYLDFYTKSKISLGGTEFDMASVEVKSLIKPYSEKSPVLSTLKYMKSPDSSGRWDSPEKLYSSYKNPIYDSYIFNNSIYIYIKYNNFSSESKYVGFGFNY